MQGIKRVIFSDCEGPISKNDNAYELCSHFIPNGDKLFANISKYDDVLADVTHKQGYAAGSTLKLILPFFKAFDVSDKQMEDFSAQNILLLPETSELMTHLQGYGEVFIVSTSYEHYIKALCKAINFPFDHTYCTKVTLDNYTITTEEKQRLKAIAEEIAKMPLIQIPAIAKSLADFSVADQALVQRLDQIFWEEIPQMTAGKLITEVKTVGGEQKAEAIKDATSRLGVKISEVMYVGDSITDVEAFKLVRQFGGLAVAFNGNSYAVRNADVAVMAEGNLVTAVLADRFCRLGKEQALKVLAYWVKSAVEQSGVSIPLLKQLYALYPGTLPRVELISLRNVDALVKESSEFRKKVRGVAIGRLG
ncbi:MAG TPA: HAD hydrolase family protein [Candidatus Acidoferrales bacterium]|nr:HAD hydrolase family protein [Candidatus Acidoferrales bacterium]